MKCLEPGKIIKSQADKNKTITLISLLLMKVATLYQIPNWGESQSIILADWIYANYQFELLETVIRTLNNPPVGDDKNWRLTPDTIQLWMAVELARLAEKREKELYNEKQKIPDNDLDILLQEAVKDSEKDEGESEVHHHRRLKTKIIPLTDEEIEREGQEKPYRKPYSSENIEDVARLAKLKIQYGRECNDLLTGHRLPDKPAFDEWLLLNYPLF
jgi:hypothetical protein